MGALVVLAMLVLAAIDYGFQRYQHEKRLKMTKDEVKQEYKQMEGSPQLKARLPKLEPGLKLMVTTETTPDLKGVNTALGGYRSGELRFYSGTTLDESLHVRTREPTLHVLTRLIREQYAPSDIAGLLRPITKEALTLGPAYRTFVSLLGLTEPEAKALMTAERSTTVREAVTTATQQGVAMADALRAVFVGLCSSVLRAKGWPA